MSTYNTISENAESTVVAEYARELRESAAYQSEAELERELIGILSRQACDYLPLKTEAELVANLRERLEALNGIKFTTRNGRIFSERSWQTKIWELRKKRGRFRKIP